MEEEVEKYRADCLALCNRLLYEMERNRDDADLFCSGEIHKAYVTVNDKVAEQVRNIKAKIRQL